MIPLLHRIISNRWYLFILFILLSPLVWNLLTQPQQLIDTWQTVPTKIQQRGTSIVTGDFHQKFIELRWGGQKFHREGIYYKIIYNPGLNYLNEAFNYLHYLKLRLYFHAGDGTNFSPAHIDPIPFVIIPAFIIGLVVIIKQQQWIPLGLLLSFTFIAYWVGIRNFALLFPTALVIYYISAIGISKLQFKYALTYIIIVIIYSLYILTSWQIAS